MNATGVEMWTKFYGELLAQIFDRHGREKRPTKEEATGAIQASLAQAIVIFKAVDGSPIVEVDFDLEVKRVLLALAEVVDGQRLMTVRDHRRGALWMIAGGFILGAVSIGPVTNLITRILG